jgi:gluconokinase
LALSDQDAWRANTPRPPIQAGHSSVVWDAPPVNVDDLGKDGARRLLPVGPLCRTQQTVTIAIVMGVSGSGKTTVAAGLARQEGWLLLEGDSFHPSANIAKMKAGIPLTDDDRWPWLQAIAAREDELIGAGQSAVVACSALKRAYRDVLIGGRRDAVLVYLRGSRALIAERMKARKNHFMPPALLDSQFATLEEPAEDEHPIIVDIGGPAETAVEAVISQLKERLS